MSKVNHLTMFLPLIVLCMGSQWSMKKHIENEHFCPSSLYKQKLKMVKEFEHVQQKMKKRKTIFPPIITKCFLAIILIS